MFRTALILSLLTASVVVVAPTEASADSFYVCKKKGQPQSWINESVVKSKRKHGWRCKKTMQFKSSPKTPSYDRPRGLPDRRGNGGTKPTTRSAPKPFPGPAGERESYEAFIQEASRRYKVPANLVRAVIRVESNFRPQVVSHAGASGLMQLMPGTAKEMAVSDIFDPRQNIMGGTRYIRLLINRFKGDARLAIAAYHAGPGAVAAKNAIPYEATKRYVRSVLKHYFRYKDTQL
ncbi:MAG: soluble lytic murein transglycosylase-like protein [Myxococcota bacterium]|jgi:soluble lytic murein transglycosylase-like protein